MAMFTSYYDTSGNDKGRVIVTAGFIGSEKQWLKCEKRWRQVLRRYKVPHIHMKDFAPNKPPLYERFANEPEEKAELMARLFLTIKREVAQSFAMSLDVPEYDAVNQDYDLDAVYGGAFPACAAHAMQLTNLWAAKHLPKQPLRFYHEDGDFQKGLLEQLMKREGLRFDLEPKVDPLTGNWFVPFQAGDLIAWEFRRAYLDWNLGKPEPRKSWIAIMRMLKMVRKHVDRDVLLRACAKYPEHFKRRVA